MKINKSFYKKNGYVILRDFFSVSIIESILKDAKNIFLKQFLNKKFTKETNLEKISKSEYNKLLYMLFNDDLETFTSCGKQVQHLISLHRLSISDKIVTLLNSYGLKSPAISTRPVMFFNHKNLAKKKVYHTVDAHQDWRSMQGSLNSVVIWIPLMNIDKSLGALEVLPGSHLNGLKTEELQSGFGMVNLSTNEKKELISVELNAGDALMFSSFLIHQSGNNISDEPRWSCHFRYNDLEDLSFIDRGYAHAYIYKPIEELITNNFPTEEDLLKIFL